jgi:hypothetical protein
MSGQEQGSDRRRLLDRGVRVHRAWSGGACRDDGEGGGGVEEKRLNRQGAKSAKGRGMD